MQKRIQIKASHDVCKKNNVKRTNSRIPLVLISLTELILKSCSNQLIERGRCLA